MPSNLPSSFASAAAGQNSNRDTRPGARSDGRGNAGGDWTRSGRSTNGGTLTFRRTSATPGSQPLNQIQASEPPQSASVDPATPSAMPPSSNQVNGIESLRYTRDELFAILDMTQDSNSQAPDVSTLFLQGWNPGHTNGATPRGWGKTGDSHIVPPEPDICWDAPGSTRAVGLQEMNPEEKELFASDVNSAMKPLVQNKDGNHSSAGLNGRKTSLSHGGVGNFGLVSPSAASRPGTRRRETTDTNPYSGGGGLISPTSATRPSRDESSWFGRKNTDPTKDSTFEEPEEDAGPRDVATKSLSFGGLMRNNSNPGGPGFGGTSPWQPSNAGALPNLGSFGHFALPGSAIGEKRAANTRGESRLAHLLPKESSDSIGLKPNEGVAPDPSRSWRPRQRTDTDPFGEDNISGSAVLGGAQDTSPPPMSHSLPHASYDTPVKGTTGDFGMSSLNLGPHPEHDQSPLSPSETNPYRSPPGERGEQEDAGDRQHGSGNPPDHPAGYSGLPRPFAHAAFDGSDRSQTSSVGAKPYPPLGNLTSWPSSNTPDRERAPFTGFGGSLFGPVGDLQSPNLGNLGGVFGPGSTTGFGGSGSFGRASKLGSLFPPAMQAQMQSQESENLGDSVPDLRQPNPLGAIGRTAPGDHARETDSPMRATRGVFDLFTQPEPARAPGSSESLHTSTSIAPHGPAFTAPNGTPSFSANQTSDLPSVQSRTMVMPDRMRWVYLDPQGHQQGPFTGLEMNDWYKANFFTPDLRVKKLEDSEFEPLGQLIRRIGNSREPFLVPQIGIPHGPPSQTGPFSANSSGVIQPPLIGAFPSFGRTLTAEEQNNLERRKQEEQYLMARHREFYATQQSIGRVPMPAVPGLHHHSSAHSLQSQPSFGSITSPAINMPPQPHIGAIGAAGSFFEAPAAHPAAVSGGSGQGLDMFREDELARLSGPERQMLAGLHNSGAVGGANHSQQSIGVPGSETSVRGQLPSSSELVEDTEGFRGRLQEFEKLRAQHEVELNERHASPIREHPQIKPTPQVPSSESGPDKESSPSAETTLRHAEGDQSTSLAKQFQQAQPQTGKPTGLPLPFPPPSATPLPAPAPQRVKSNLPEQYATSSRSGTPDMASSNATQPPPLAPWAKDGGLESHKGPSLKEIQQAEALKAAKAEEAAALARRILLEQETAREREKAAAVAPGLPMTSTWGTASPVTPAATNSPWSKPTPGKTPAPGHASQAQATDKKKTLADIQREEEARKQKAKEITHQTGPATSGSGKRYADLASKPNAIPVPNPAPGPSTSGWATVGAGGKVKVPTGPASQGRAASSASSKSQPTSAAVPPRPAGKPTGSTSGPTHTEAMEEFTKWLHSQLAKGITGVTDIEAFANTLIGFPLVGDLISDAIYANSKTMDGRHFAEEFIRRKKLADKGVVEKQPAKSPSSEAQSSTAGGWNEVAKKSNHKEPGNDASSIQGAGFKVVPGRKKGKK